MDRIRRLASHMYPEQPELFMPSPAMLEAQEVAAQCSREEGCCPAPKRVLITGAAGQICYSLVFLVASGNMLGPDQPVILHLLDIPQAEAALKGVVMELQDGAYPLLHSVVATTDIKTAFSNVDVALLVGARPRTKGMERADLLKANVGIFKEQGKALNDYASPNVKVCVVGNPANTNCLIAMKYAPRIPRENFSALTRLDQNRAVAMIAEKAQVGVGAVRNIIIWGNHSTTQYPDVSQGKIRQAGRPCANVADVVPSAWVQGPFIAAVQQRGGAVIAARKASSAASAAKAITDHVRDWVLGTREGHIVSMAVASDGSYGVAKDLIFSFPVTCRNGQWSIVQNLPVSEFSRKMLAATEAELVSERDAALQFTQ